MKSTEYFETLKSHWTGQLVVCALGENSNEWWRLTRDLGSFHLHGGMGFASSFAMGLAYSLPDEEIWLLNSDGGVCMNLGGLLTEAQQQPPNLKHFLLSNRCYQCLLGAPLVNSEHTDYATIARGTGMRNVHRADSAEELNEALTSLGPEHAFVVSEVEPHRRDWRFEPPPPFPYEGPEAKYVFARHVERRTGRTIFGPRGY
ncbi:MAG TPA: thiamine pyrophosphate-dependent enzyme [Candidatus Limnocylindria bacterium]|nr:thiamine pyrophosphate-dependent enzyme [Candidatus Limnocylindria bacterium]